MKINICTICVVFVLFGCNNDDNTSVNSQQNLTSPEVPTDLVATNTSQYWTQFVETRSSDSLLFDQMQVLDEDVLPDFSYAGYQLGEESLPQVMFDDPAYTTYNVVDYGAIGNDRVSDKQAIKNAISAIKTARTNGDNSPVILYFPEGTYVTNDDNDLASIDPLVLDDVLNKQPIDIDFGNVIIKGDGMGKSTLFMANELYPENPSKKWTTPFLFQVGAPDKEIIDGPSSAVVSSNIPYSSLSVEVQDGTVFNVGDSIEIAATITDQAVIEASLSPYVVEHQSDTETPLWTNLTQGAVKIEKHIVESIDGNTLTFRTPIAHEINPQDHAWTISKINSLSNIGIEDLTFQGNWNYKFTHHKDALNDSGYSLLLLKNINNSWVKNVEFKDFNQASNLSNTFNVTIKDVNLTGTPGHMAISILYGNNNLTDNIQDTAKTWHAPGVSKYSISNVHKDLSFDESTNVDLHGEQSIDNLFDGMTGGWVYGRWGASKSNQPNHLQGLIFWNPTNIGEAMNNFMFMKDDSDYGRVIMPYVIGLEGNPVSFEYQSKYMSTMVEKNKATYAPELLCDTGSDGNLECRGKLQAYVESNGKAVSPPSLYDAQLSYRLAQ